MQSGEYVADRWMVGLIKELCHERSVDVRCFSDDWVIRLQKGDSVNFVIGYKFGINTAAAAAIAQDKVATYELLEADSIAAVSHYLARTKVTAEVGWRTHAGEKFVVKPLVGTSGHSVRLFSDVSRADEWMQRSGIEAWAVSPYVEIANETRLVMLDGAVLLAYAKSPVEVQGLRMFNLGKGAVAQDIAPSQTYVQLAIRAMSATGLRLAAIDIVELTDGSVRVLEINEGIMMEHYMRQSPENKQRAREVYSRIIDAMVG